MIFLCILANKTCLLWCVLQVHVRDFLVWLCAFIATCFAGIELGLAVSLGLSLIVIIFETAFPHAALLGRVQKTSVYRCGMLAVTCCKFCCWLLTKAVYI